MSFSIRQVSGIFLIKALSVATTFGLSVLTANILEVDDYGLFNYWDALISLLGTFSLLGFNLLIVRDLPQADSQEKKADLINGAFKSTLYISLLLSLGLLSFFWLNSNFNNKEYIIIFGLVPFSLYKLLGFWFQAENKFLTGAILDKGLQSLLIICILGLISILYINIDFVVVSIAFLISSCAILGLSFKRVNRESLIFSRRLSIKNWIDLARKSFVFFSTSAVGIFNSNLGIYLLGFYSFEKVAFFTPAVKISLMGQLFLMSTNIYLRPTVSRLIKEKKLSKVKQIYLTGVLFNFAVGTTYLLVILIFSNQILQLFGDEFVFNSGKVVKIIAFQSFINLIFGSGGSVLNMSGQEKKERNSNLVFTASTLIIFLALYLFIGSDLLIAMAISMTLSSLFQNIYRVYFVNKYLSFQYNDFIQSYREMWRDIASRISKK